MQKKCSKCGETKDLTLFGRDKHKEDGLTSQCKPCYSAQQKVAYRRRGGLSPKTREKHKVERLKRQYGLSLEDYDRMLEQQGGVCAICHKPVVLVDPRSGAVKRLSVDHDHETGKVRGLLCHKCNALLGQADDSIFSLLAAVDYLARNSRGVK